VAFSGTLVTTGQGVGRVTTVVTADGACEVTGVGYKPQGEVRRDSHPINLDQEPVLTQLVRAGLLCNDADLRQDDGEWRPKGDPMEGALITLAMKAQLHVDEQRIAWRTLDTIPFESCHRFEVDSVPPDRADLLSPEGLSPPLPMVDGIVVKHHTSIGADDLLWDRRRARLHLEAHAAQDSEGEA
jgi:hypothetical protein